ncbi:MAG: nodulation protein NfeD [Anaerolineales bacterium]
MRGIRIAILGLGLLLVAASPRETPTQKILWLDAEGAVTPAMSTYIQRGIRLAEGQDAMLLVLQLNTPGGDIGTMQDIVEAMRASTVPIVVYVAPQGAMAGSAGTVITLAGDLAAMAPDTAIGAASPVGPQGQDLGTTEEAKTKSILKALARSLAAGRSPTALNLIDSTIDEAKAASASEALQAGMIDIVASSRQDLLDQLNGRTIHSATKSVILQTSSAQVEEVPANLLEEMLQVLTDPNIVFILLAVGAGALLIEISHPAGWVAGFAGVVFLALAFYGLGVLSVNWFGLIFVLLAFVLFIVDIKAATHGALTAAGLASFIAGSLILFNSPGTPPFQRVSVPLVVVTGVAIAATFVGIVTLVVRAHRRPTTMGKETLVGRVGRVMVELAPQGMVQAGGELWSAMAATPPEHIAVGEKVEILGVKGLKLTVRKLPDAGKETNPPDE